MPAAIADTPLAFRLRPTALDDFVGQDHIVGNGTPLRMTIEQDRLRSVIFAGPPGTGKTTLAKIIATSTKANFVQLNAVSSGIKELKVVCEEAQARRTQADLFTGSRTVLFIDEIHRFNTSQQDALLPYVENGTVILIGATTQNPYFDVNQSLMSRSQVALFKPLAVPDILAVLRRAVAHTDGYAGKLRISDDALAHLATVSNGDARIALNALELAVMTFGESRGKRIGIEQARSLFRERSKRHDKSGEDHYNVVSAFIKTMRGSDPDAAMVWLFHMIESGEDPRFLFRRMAIFASEDVGNADPRALHVVVSAWQAFELVGLPEGEYFLAHACIYLAQAPKSNAVKRAKDGVKESLRRSSGLEVPNILRNAPVKGMREQGYGVGYRYPHDHPEGVVAENYWPLGWRPLPFYEPTGRGFEAEVRERMDGARALLRGAPERDQDGR